MNRGYLLIDANNIGHAANGMTPLRVGDQPTQAVYGFLRAIRPIISAFTMLTPVVLWDGRSWRHSIYADYKANRKKEATTKAEIAAAALREQYKLQSPLIRSAVKALGIRQAFAMNYEADDIAGMLVERYASIGKRVVLISGDKDWLQLLRSNVAWVDPIKGDRVMPQTLPQRLGYHPEKKKISVYKGEDVQGFIGVPSTAAWLEIKAMMGDVSDGIPGVGGIGPAGAIALIVKFGSVDAFMNGVIDKSIDEAKLPKKLRDFATDMEKMDNFRRNMRLMDLTTKDRPVPVNFTVTRPNIDLEAFRALCNKLLFKSILSDFDNWTQPFLPREEQQEAA